MPIHVRAEPGDYADACLLPGDPLRAQYIAETYFDEPVQRNHERGMLGYTGTWDGKPISVQATGMGCPSAAIVMEELVQLGVKRFIRVGTCGGLQPDLELGDMIVALTAVPADRTVETYVDHEPHCPTASWELVHGAVHAAKEIGQADARRADRLERRLLQPRQRAVRALVEARRARRRDGGRGAVHARRAARRGRRLRCSRSATSSSRESSSGSRTTSCARRSTA